MSAIATSLTQSGQRRVFRCPACATHCAETRETVFFDLRPAEAQVMMALKRLLVRVDLAGIGFVLGVTEATVLAWLRRAAHQAEAINHHLLRHLPVTQGQLAEMGNFGERQTSSFCKARERMRQRVGFFQAFYKVARPHLSLRQQLPLREHTRHGVSRPRWRARTPAMAAGLTDHVWTFRELLTATFEPLESQSISQ